MKLTVNGTAHGVYLYDHGTGTFTSDPSLVSAPSALAGHDLDLADIDGDGDLDALLARAISGAPAALRNNGGMLVDDTATIVPAGFVNRGATFGDVDGDGDVDILLDVDNGVLINDGTGSFTDQTAALLDSDRDSSSIAVGDLDADGDLDFVETRRDYGLPVIPYFNDGSGKFAAAMRVVTK